MIPVPAFEQVSVISDLHMGGEEDFQIFRQGALLAAYIDSLRAPGPARSALVINGDMIDFLAENPARYFDPEGAIAKLDRMAADPSFAPVWDALTAYVQTPDRYLAITLGNHDLELALPWVRQHLIGKLSGGDPAAAGRVTCAFEGTGFACKVGTANVLCVHGNEVDTWNLTDYEALRRIACDLVQRRGTPEWTPNAGTKLVIDVMNSVKREFPFIDLLKPEKDAAVKLLMLLRPDQTSKLRDAAAIAQRRVWDGVRRRMGFLSAGEEAAAGARDPLAPFAGQRTSMHPTDLLDRAEESFQANQNPVDMVADPAGKLGWWDATVALARRRPDHEVAFEAVKELMTDTTFDVTRADPDFEHLDELAGPAVDFLIAGHTHLARDLARKRAAGRYFNSGTWATLMKFRKDALQSAATFEPVFRQLRSAKKIADLKGLTEEIPHVVTIASSGTGASASLQLVTRKDKKIVLKAVK